MSATDERNERVVRILYELYDKAIDDTIIIDETPYNSSINKLFSTTAWGFREILLVVIVAMKLDINFRATTALYDCNPRAIYEGPIKEFLIDKNIPHRKSGPLNVAKAAVGLDMSWAAQRRPHDVAAEVVAVVEYLEKNHTKIDDVGISLIRRLIAESSRVDALSIEIEPTSDAVFLYNVCRELIVKTPDAGNTPQRISAFLLKNYHLYFHTGIDVTGGEDRASVTSTTSKKPGDVNEESLGIILKVYEITVKPFDVDRIRDSYDCVEIYNETHSTDINEIIVICRKEDCPDGMEPSGLQGYLGRYIYRNMIYYYWDIFEWIASMLQRMNTEGRYGFYLMLNSYINEPNTSEAVKLLWRQLHE